MQEQSHKQKVFCISAPVYWTRTLFIMILIYAHIFSQRHMHNITPNKSKYTVDVKKLLHQLGRSKSVLKLHKNKQVSGIKWCRIVSINRINPDLNQNSVSISRHKNPLRCLNPLPRSRSEFAVVRTRCFSCGKILTIGGKSEERNLDHHLRAEQLEPGQAINMLLEMTVKRHVTGASFTLNIQLLAVTSQAI